MRLVIAIRAFFAALFDRQAAEKIGQALEDRTAAPAEPTLPAPTKPASAATKPARSDAVTLLSALQREARLVDLIQEDLANFSDAQVGAAARPCLQQCAATLQRLLSLTSVVDAQEGETIDVGSDASPARYQWIGEGTTSTGKLVHHGWLAAKIELPKWTGEASDSKIVAPAQVQR
jgi:hypothetical protein